MRLHKSTKKDPDLFYTVPNVKCPTCVFRGFRRNVYQSRTLLAWRRHCRYKHQRILLLPLNPLKNSSLTSPHRIFPKTSSWFSSKKITISRSSWNFFACATPTVLRIMTRNPRRPPLKIQKRSTLLTGPMRLLQVMLFPKL